MKTCNYCKELKSLSEYHTYRKDGKEYKQGHCKECHRAYSLKNFADNKEARKSKAKEWRDNNKEHKKLMLREWRAKNPDKVKAADTRYSTKFYAKVSSPKAQKAVALFERMGESQRYRFANWIMKQSTTVWEKAKRVHVLDDWLGAYSGI